MDELYKPNIGNKSNRPIQIMELIKCLNKVSIISMMTVSLAFSYFEKNFFMNIFFFFNIVSQSAFCVFAFFSSSCADCLMIIHTE